MADTQSTALEVQEKQKQETGEEQTAPATYFRAYTDIYETEDTLIVVLEMPGVDKKNVDIQIDNDVLAIEGRIDFGKYAELQPVYSEYNVGHYSRRFTLSSKIDQSKISAEMADGVLTVVLPKSEEAKTRRIPIH